MNEVQHQLCTLCISLVRTDLSCKCFSVFYKCSLYHPSLSTRAKFLTFNRVQSRVLTGLMGHNTLRRHHHLLGLLDSPLCRKCGVGEENSAHILCECEALASLRHAYLGSFFLEPEDIRLDLGAMWNYSKVLGLPWIRYGAQRARSIQGLGASALRGPEPRCKSIDQSSLYHYSLQTVTSVTEEAISKKQIWRRILAQTCGRNSMEIFKYIKRPSSQNHIHHHSM